MESSRAVLYAEFWARLMDNLFNDQIVNEELDEMLKPMASTPICRLSSC